MNNNVKDQLSRMKAMMNYGLTTEGKKQYSSVEYSNVGADGKLYGIIREGAKYYIKIGNDKNKLVKENFEYIGGFVNRKNNEYSSYANALKQFDLKMISLKEAKGNGKNIVIESWNPDKQENLAVESTEKMRKEIMRQRQIMSNASIINEGKDGCCDCEGGDPFCCDVDKEYKVGEDKSEFKANKVDDKSTDTCAEVNESAEPLAWHKDGQDTKGNIADTYMDTSKGTEVGSDAPFDEKPNTNGKEASNGVVEESESMAMDCGDNQNSPSVGTGEVGDDAPFDGEKGKQLDESLEDIEDEEMIDDEPSMDSEDGDFEDDEELPFPDAEEDGDEFEDTADDTEYELETYDDLDSDEDLEGGDMESRLSSIESTLQTILDKLSSMNDSEYDDDTLYDDSESEDETMDDMPMDDAPMGDEEMPMEDEPMDDDTEIYESRSYRKMMNEENRLDMFGKHPAYRKKPMELPQTGEDKNSHGRDWNDESVHGEQPYGEKIGSSAPFEVDPKDIENSIAECVKRILKNRI